MTPREKLRALQLRLALRLARTESGRALLRLLHDTMEATKKK